MPTSSPSHTSRFSFQRFHPALQTGDTLSVLSQRQQPVPVFFQQSTLDGACGLHVLAMVLSIHGIAQPGALESMSRRQSGVAADVWQAFKDTYFSGVLAADLVARVQSMGVPLALKLVTEAGMIDRFAMTALLRGELVALSMVSIRNRRTNHWALGVGVEGRMVGRHSQPTALLLLDPGCAEPAFGCVFNARLRLPELTQSQRAKLGAAAKSPTAKPLAWLYEAAGWPGEPMRLTSAVRFRLAAGV
jgi:hypothetical protein